MVTRRGKSFAKQYNESFSWHDRASQHYELIGFTDKNGHMLLAFLVCLATNPLNVSKTCPSCHCYSEAANVPSWSHALSLFYPSFLCSDRSLHCVWCTIPSSQLSALVIDSHSLSRAIGNVASQDRHPATFSG